MISRITINTPISFQDDLPESADVVIIGGGVIGIFSALYLARCGKKVVVCEKGRIAGEQSSRNWGWIRQHGRDEAELPIATQALSLWHEINEETKGACGVKTTGIQYLASTEAEMQKLEEWLEIAHRYDVPSRSLSGEEIAESFGGLSNGKWVGGTLTENDAKGEPWQAVPSVAKLAHEEGVLIRENCAVRALDMEAGAIKAVVTEAGPVKAEQVILAGGAWSSLFARAHGINIPQLCVKSSVLQTQEIFDFPAPTSADEELALRRRDDGGFTLAVSDGHDFYLGPDAFRHFKSYLGVMKHSFADTSFHLAAPKGFPDAWGTARSWPKDGPSPFEACRVLEPLPNQGFLKRMQDRWSECFPNLEKAQIKESWAGMIDSMPDVVPIVDRVPHLQGLIIATGMSGHGFGIGPGMGMAIAKMICGEKTDHDMSRFRFSRFSDGSPLIMGPAL